MKLRNKGCKRSKKRGLGIELARTLSFEPLEERRVLASFYVSADSGSDSNIGSFSQPFATVSRGAQLAQAGDTVFIREGVYREQVTVPRSGNASNPITFTAYNNEDVVISGADLVTGWTPHSGDVWVASANWNAGNDRDNNTLFVDGELKLEGRHHSENDPLSIDDWGRVPRGRLSTGASSFDVDDLGSPNDYWNGAKIKFHTLDWVVETKTIVDSTSGGFLTLDSPMGSVNQKQDTGYYIYDTLNAVDRPGEWFKQSGGNALYYHAEAGQNPNSLEIEFKRRAFAFDLRGRDHIRLEGLEFRGASISTDGNTDRNVYAGNRFYAYDKGNFGRFFVTGDENVLRDNEISHTWNSFLTVRGTRNDIINNDIHDIGFYATARVIVSSSAEELLFSHNTVSTFARSFMDGYPSRSEIAYNVFEDGGNLSWDTGVFDADGGNGDASQSIFHHNIFRNHDARGIYEGFYGRNSNAVIHHNVFHDFEGNRPVFRSSGLDFRQAFHNTFISDVNSAPVGAIEALDAVQTRYNNNVQITVERMEALGVDVRGNFDFSTSDFVNFGGDDFRLSAGSGAIDAGIVVPGINDGFLGAAPDAGAYEFGAPIWTAGHDFASPPNPSYAWQALPGTNIYENGQFLDGIDDWTNASGSPRSQDFNSWNLQASGTSLTGTFRTRSVELTPGESISRVFSGLQPNTTYTLGATARVVNLVTVANQFSASSGSIVTGTHRGEPYATDLSSGEWVRYSSINFGELGQFNQLSLRHIRDPRFLSGSTEGATIQVRLDSPTGQLLSEFSNLATGNGADIWRSNTVDLTSVSGARDIYVSVSGPNASNVAFGSFLLTNDSPPTEDLLTVEISSFGRPQTSAQIGNDQWQSGYEELTFRTGSSTSNATIKFANNGRVNGYLDRLYLIEGQSTRGAAPVDISTGAAAERSLTPTTSGPANRVTDSFTGNLTTTGDHPGSWIQVDLGQSERIHSIQLFTTANFPQKLTNFRLSVWNADPRDGGTELWAQDYLTDGSSLNVNENLLVQADARAVDGNTKLGATAGRFVRIQSLGLNNAGDQQLAVGEIKVLGFDESNFAVSDGVATQSTTSAGQTATNAIDGDANTQSATLPTDTNSWWQVRFAQGFSTGRIELTNRDDADFGDLSNFNVSVWDEDPALGGTRLWQKSYFGSGSVAQGATFVIDGSEISDLDGYTRLATAHRGRVVRVQLNGTNNEGNGRLALEAVRVTSGDQAAPTTNLALSGVASQSNDLYGLHRGAAPLANDGIILPISNFTSTPNESGAWWQLDLGQATPIDQIVLFNRTDAANRLNNFRVSVWNDDPQNGGSELWGRNYNYSSSAPDYSTNSIGAGGALLVNGNTTSGGLRLDEVSGGRYVRVQLNGANILSLVEVQIWEPDTLVRTPFDPSLLSYDLGTTTSPVATGFERVSPDTYGDLWWIGEIQSDDRGGSGTDRDFVTGDSPATIHHTLPNGMWNVTVEMGDPVSARQDMMLWAEHQLISGDIDASAGQTTTLNFDVMITDGVLELALDSMGNNGWALNSLVIDRMDVSVPLPGDYSDNGVVDAADFTVWRDNFGTSNIMLNDVTPGVVDMSDYDVWVNNFGTTLANPTIPGDSTPASDVFSFGVLVDTGSGTVTSDSISHLSQAGSGKELGPAVPGSARVELGYKAPRDLAFEREVKVDERWLVSVAENVDRFVTSRHSNSDRYFGNYGEETKPFENRSIELSIDIGADVQSRL